MIHFFRARNFAVKGVIGPSFGLENGDTFFYLGELGGVPSPAQKIYSMRHVTVYF